LGFGFAGSFGGVEAKRFTVAADLFFLGGALGVEGEEATQNFFAKGIGPAVAKANLSTRSSTHRPSA
jgi:hypothetical protein